MTDWTPLGFPLGLPRPQRSMYRRWLGILRRLKKAMAEFDKVHW